jgi:MFS family permease
MTWSQQAALSFYWFAVNAHWSAILVFLLPIHAEALSESDSKGWTLGLILFPGALVAMVVAPLFGAWSDRLVTRWGRRRPFLVVGTLGNVIGLVVLSLLPASQGMLVFYIAVFMWIQLFNNLATAPYSALIPDVVAPEQRGSASGWMGLMAMLGALAGAGTGFVLKWIGTSGAYLAISAVLILGMLGTVLFVREPNSPPMPPFSWGAFLRGLAEPFRSRDFTWVFLTRFLVVLGTFTVQEFIEYYMKDVVAPGEERYALFGWQVAASSEEATTWFVLALLGGATLSALVAGRLSDRFGRKLMVYLSGGLQGLVALIFLFAPGFTMTLGLGLIFGLGFGAYQAVDWALASDVLPSQENYAKDMGVWHIAFTLPQVLATPIGGGLRDHFQRVGRHLGLPFLGYSVIFGIAFVYFVLGSVLVRQVKGAK